MVKVSAEEYKLLVEESKKNGKKFVENFFDLEPNTTIIIGASGYSSIKPEHLAKWGIIEGEYEAACRSILHGVIESIKKEFPFIHICFVHGSSDMGIDKVVINLCKELGIKQIGFSCPEYISYVKDQDDFTVIVLENNESYSDAYIDSLDILYAMNGRLQSLNHDITASIIKRKKVVPIDIITTISTTGYRVAYGPDNQVENAVLALYETMTEVFGVTESNFMELNKKIQNKTLGLLMRIVKNSLKYTSSRFPREE